MEGKFISLFKGVDRRSKVPADLALRRRGKLSKTTLNGGRWKLIKGFMEVESGKPGADTDTELRKALEDV